MSLASTFKNFISAKDFEAEDYLENEEDFYDDYEETLQSAPRIERATPVQISKTENEKILSLNSKRDYDIRSFSPDSTAELANISQQFKNGVVCIINIKNLSDEEAQTTADFISGAAFALNGTIKSLSEEILIATPSNVGFKGEVAEAVSKYTKQF